jgi:transaldolase
MTPLQTLIASGTKLWLDSVDPDEVVRNRIAGATGATSNPIIIADLIQTGRFDRQLQDMLAKSSDNDAVAWNMTDLLVRKAQEEFARVWSDSNGDDGYVSFELDPLLEDSTCTLSTVEKSRRYVDLAQKWSAGHTNRMIKVPATPGGLGALEEIAAAGVPLNVTLVFSERQYVSARDAIWRGAQRCSNLRRFKSVYSIFVSRLDVYSEKHVPTLSPAAQGLVGIVNAKRLWRLNREFWLAKQLPLHQEIVFASTGTKKASDPPWNYVEAFAGADIQTNPPATNAAVEASKRAIVAAIEELPDTTVLQEIDAKVDMAHLEETLMREGLQKFADPQKSLIQLIRRKRESMPST